MCSSNGQQFRINEQIFEKTDFILQYEPEALTFHMNLVTGYYNHCIACMWTRWKVRKGQKIVSITITSSQSMPRSVAR